MIDSVLLRIWMYRAVFLAVLLVLVFVHLLPVSALPRGWPGPDLIFALVFAWLMRRPEYLPVWFIAGIALLLDLLFQRPPGLWAAVIVIATEGLRSRTAGTVELPFLAEWAAFAGTLLAMLLVYHGVLWTTSSDIVRIGLVGIAFAQTVLLYPVVVAFTHFALGVRRADPGSVEQMGRLA